MSEILKDAGGLGFVVVEQQSDGLAVPLERLVEIFAEALFERLVSLLLAEGAIAVDAR